MWIYKFIGIALFAKALVGKIDFEAQRLGISQSKKLYDIERIGSVDIAEISGMVISGDSIFVLTDSGGEAAVYILNFELSIIDTIKISGSRNKDWEAMAIDHNKTLYIGDFGNNSNRRKDLSIYKYNEERLDTISISYSQQLHFPPERKEMNFDSESLFWNNNNLHLFSKNRGRKCVKHYVLNDKSDSINLTPIEELRLNSMITGAAISPDEELVALMGYGKIYFFQKGLSEAFFPNMIMMIESTKFGQNEAIAFKDNNTLVLCNEAGFFLKITLKLPI